MSDRRQRANRANAKSSTGPKTAAGKALAAQNAFRHGLNVPVLSRPFARAGTLGARFRGPPIEVQKIKEIFRAVPPESEETLAIVAESFMHDTVTGGGLRPIIDLTSVQCCR